MRTLHTLLLLAIVTLLPRTSHSQYDWEELPFPTGATSAITGCYFINEDIGFLFNGVNLIGTTTPANIFRTLDGGRSWEKITALDSMYGAVFDIYFDSIHHGYATVYNQAPSGTIENMYRDARGRGIYESHDTGRTWKKISSLVTSSEYLNFLTVYGIGQTIAAYYKRSTDRGVTWIPWACERGFSSEISGTPEGLVFFAGYRQCPSDGFMSTHSKDSGKTWVTYENADVDFHAGDHYIHRGSGRIFITAYERVNNFAEFSRLLVSDDTGKTWTKKWESYNANEKGRVIFSIEGGGCAVYAQTSGDTNSGLMRSTDLGETWQDVGGPLVSSSLRAFSVVGNGAVVYALGYKTNPFNPGGAYRLFKTRTGGDGKLSPVGRPGVLELSHKLHSSPAHPSTSQDTLHARLCDSASFEVFFNYGEDCSFARLRKIEVEGLPKQQVRATTVLRPINDNLTDSASAVIFPETAGTYNLKVTATYEHDAKTAYDTSFNIVLVVHPNPSTLTVTGKKEYDLGLQRLCNIQTVIDSFSISATGCDPYRVKSIRFEEETQNSGYSFTEVQDLILTPDGSERKFKISFTPNAAGTFRGRIIIEREDGADTLNVTASAADDDRVLVVASDTVESRMCESGETIVSLTNTSCREMTLDSLVLPPPLYLETGQLPLTIGAGKTIEIRIRFEPEVLGSQTIDATGFLRFMAQTETIAFDTLVRLTILGLRGSAQTVTTDTVINVGKISICSQQEFNIPVTSIGCDTLLVDNVTLGSADLGFTITNLPNDHIPVGESSMISLRFTPGSVGAFSTTLTIATSGGTRTIMLRGEGVAGTKTLAASLGVIDFGETNICEERDSTVRFTNTGCDTLVITNADIDKNFELIDVEYPIVLPPSASVDLEVITDIDTTGKPTELTGNLTVTSTADNSLQPIALTRSLSYPTRLRIEAIDEASGRVGDEVKFNLILEGDVPPTMSALHFDFLHDNDLLSFTDLQGNGLTITNTSCNANQRQSFTFSPVNVGVIGELTFKAYLAQSENTTLTFDNIRFDAAGLTVAPECIAVISDSGSRFNYIYSCGEGMVKEYLVNNQVLIRSISPNPASDEIVLDLDRAVTSITIYDGVGREILRNEGNDRVDTRSLPVGAYYITARSVHSAQTKRVMIER